MLISYGLTLSIILSQSMIIFSNPKKIKAVQVISITDLFRVELAKNLDH